MQPQGLEALMQSQPMPQMDNPRLAAATDVVSSDAEEQILDPRTLAMLKYKDALQAMQAADQMMASAQPAPTAPTVAERTKLAAEQGIAGLAQRLSPGVQQQGSQMAAQQGAGGLPQLSAPNMAGMAGGGIVGYAPGGAVNPAPTPTKVVPRPIPMGQPNVASQAAASDDVARYIYNYTNLRSSMEAATDPQQKAEIAQILREMQQTYSPDIVAEAHMKMSQQSGMAGGGVVALQAGGRLNLNGGIASPSAATLAAVEAMRAKEAGPDPLADRFNQQMSIDPEEAARTRADRLMELTGVKELIEQRRVEQERLRALDEAQFSPEKERSRLLRAALAGGAESGLSGFSSGYDTEAGAIASERRASQERAIADMDKTIAELRAMGLSQFEAENVARAGAEAQQQAGAAALEARRAEEEAEELERAKMANALNIAEVQVNAQQNTDFSRNIDIREAQIIADSPGMDPVAARRTALQDYVDDETRVQLARLGVSEESLSLQQKQAAARIATDRIGANYALSPEEKTELYPKYYAEALSSLTGGPPPMLNDGDTPPPTGGVTELPEGFELD